MVKRSSKGKENEGDVQLGMAGSGILRALLHECPSVTAILLNKSADLINFKISYRGAYDYLSILKRYDSDGTPVIIFGSGSDFASCLLGLEAAVDQDKWRPDKWANK